MTAALEGGEWSAARTGRTLRPGKSRYPFYRRLGGPQGRSGPAEYLVPTRIRFRTVQPIAQSLYRLSHRAHSLETYWVSFDLNTAYVRDVGEWTWHSRLSDAGNSFIGSGLKHTANRARDGLWSCKSRSDQRGLEGRCTAVWNRNGKFPHYHSSWIVSHNRDKCELISLEIWGMWRKQLLGDV